MSTIRDEGSLRRYRTEVPNSIVKGKMAEGLSYHARWLYVYLKSVAGDSGTCYQGTKTIVEGSGLSAGKISDCKKELEVAGLIHREAPREHDEIPGTADRITIVDVWPENMDEYRRSPHEQTRSLSEGTRSPHEQTRSLSETKKEPYKKEPKKKKPGKSARARKPDAEDDPVKVLTDTWNVRPSPYQRDKIAATVDDLGRWRELVERFALEAKTQRRCIAWLIDDYENPKPTHNGEADENPEQQTDEFAEDDWAGFHGRV